MCNKIKRQLYATVCECEICSNQILLGRSVVLAVKCSKTEWPIKVGRTYQTALQNDGFNALRLKCINSTLRACAMIPNQQNFTRHNSGCQIGRVRVTCTFKSDQAQWLRLEVLSLQSCKYFENFFCFHRTLGISPKDLEGFKADIAFIYTALACSMANLPQILTFVTRNFIGSCIIRCAFWLVSRKDDCLECELRKSFWIKKSINKISLHLSN